jgi:segregation and condensation protein A
MVIKIEKFEGPLSLLMQLIEKEELDITQISLAKIADQYIEYIGAATNIDPEEMADFLVVAARLLLIKSKALLPYLFPEEEEEIKDLENQLKMYQEFLAATKQVQKILSKKRFMFARPFNRKALFFAYKFFSLPKKLKAGDLSMVMTDLIGRIKPFILELSEERLERKINIEEKIASIRHSLFERLKVRFSQILGLAKSKTEIIVSFLAMLELIKQKEVFVEQGELFGEIEINKI